jgi:hypothetical protein
MRTALETAPLPALLTDQIPLVTHLHIDDRQFTGDDEAYGTARLTPKKVTFSRLALRVVKEAAYAKVAEGANHGIVVTATLRDGAVLDATAAFLGEGWKLWRELGEMFGDLQPLGCCPVEAARERVDEARQIAADWSASRDRARERARVATAETDAVRIAARDGSGRATEAELTAARSRQSTATRAWTKAEDRLAAAESELRAAEDALAELLADREDDAAPASAEPAAEVTLAGARARLDRADAALGAALAARRDARGVRAQEAADHAVARAQAEYEAADDALVQLLGADEPEAPAAVEATVVAEPPAPPAARPAFELPADIVAARQAFEAARDWAAAVGTQDALLAAALAAEPWLSAAHYVQMRARPAPGEREGRHPDGTPITTAEYEMLRAEYHAACDASCDAQGLLDKDHGKAFLRATLGFDSLEYQDSYEDEDEDDGDDEPPTPPTGGGIPARRSASPPWATGRYGIPPRGDHPAVVEAGPRVILDDDAELPAWARGPNARPAVHLGRGIHAVDLGALLSLPGDQPPPRAAAPVRRPAPPVGYGIEVVLGRERTAWLRRPGTGVYAGVRPRGEAADVLDEDERPLEGLAGMPRAAAWKAALGRMREAPADQMLA